MLPDEMFLGLAASVTWTKMSACSSNMLKQNSFLEEQPNKPAKMCQDAPRKASHVMLLQPLTHPLTSTYKLLQDVSFTTSSQCGT
jgi:hypothetical protein